MEQSNGCGIARKEGQKIMCLYPRLYPNKKYQENSKNGGNIPTVQDSRVNYVAAGCQKCMECRKQKAREWTVRLMEDIKHNKNGQFVTLTFSTESIKKLNEDKIQRKNKETGLIEEIWIKDLEGYDKDNAIAKRGVRLFLERWRKHSKKSARHFLVTELGHKNTEHVHLHGIIYANDWRDIRKHWQYGFVWDGYSENGIRINYVNDQTVNYTTKYIHKVDLTHKEYRAIVLCSPGIGSAYINKETIAKHKFKENLTEETYRTKTGHLIALPKYYRNKIWNDDEREALWLHTLDKEIRYVNKHKIDISKGEENYYKALESARQLNKQLKYGDDKKNWKRITYELERRKMIHEYRIN